MYLTRSCGPRPAPDVFPLPPTLFPVRAIPAAERERFILNLVAYLGCASMAQLEHELTLSCGLAQTRARDLLRVM